MRYVLHVSSYASNVGVVILMYVIPVVFCTIVAVRYVNTYSRTQLYCFLYYRSVQQHVSTLYVGHHQVVVRLSA